MTHIQSRRPQTALNPAERLLPRRETEGRRWAQAQGMDKTETDMYFTMFSTAAQNPGGVFNPRSAGRPSVEGLPARAHATALPFGAACRGGGPSSARRGRSKIIKNRLWEPLRYLIGLLQLLARE